MPEYKLDACSEADSAGSMRKAGGLAGVGEGEGGGGGGHFLPTKFNRSAF